MEYSQSEIESQLERERDAIDITPDSAMKKLKEGEKRVFGDQSNQQIKKRKRALQYELAQQGRVLHSLASIEKNIETIKNEMQSQRDDRQRWRQDFSQQIDKKIECTLSQSFSTFKDEWDREKRDIMNMVEGFGKGKQRMDNKLNKLQEKLENLLNMLQ